MISILHEFSVTFKAQFWFRNQYILHWVSLLILYLFSSTTMKITNTWQDWFHLRLLVVQINFKWTKILKTSRFLKGTPKVVIIASGHSWLFKQGPKINQVSTPPSCRPKINSFKCRNLIQGLIWIWEKINNRWTITVVQTQQFLHQIKQCKFNSCQLILHVQILTQIISRNKNSRRRHLSPHILC
jgi:hypothetical protein